MASPQRVPSPFALPPTRRHRPLPLPPPEEVKEKLYHHPEAERIRSGQLGEWFTTPLVGGEWTEWGKHARPDRIGMTFMAINRVSSNPEPTNEPARRLMHSRYIKTHRSISPELEEKIAPKYGTAREMDRRDQVWIEHAAELTEEALDRQMRPARQLRWEDMTPLPDDLERAFDQFATYLIQAMYLCSDASGPWNGLIHYGFAEVKSFLAYELFDYNLMCGLLRKRVMANGGGMGVQVEGLGAGLIDICNESSHGFVGEVERDFSAVIFAIDVLFNSIMLEMARLAQAGARSRFDRHLMTQLVQDCARHVAFGCRRIGFYLRNCADREEAAVKLHLVADQLEPLQTEHHMLNPKVLEPLAIMLGGSGAATAEGMRVVRKFWPQFGENYLARLDSIGLARRDRCLIPAQAPF
ncbi:MAG TPA: hypothetical protein VKB84_23025 [Candidatus Binataceae bacterium]|nr:hypothetical protein [Candidatus Binataceae bacterium]